MKTLLIDSATRDLIAINQLFKENCASLTNIKWMPFHAWLHDFYPQFMSKENQLIYVYKKLAPLAYLYPIYGKMFSYPQFIQQVVNFTQDLALSTIFKEYLLDQDWNNIIDTLPNTLESEKELKKIIELCLTDSNLYPSLNPLSLDFTNFNNIASTNSFSTNIYDTLVHEKCVLNGLAIEPIQSIQNPSYTYRHALNQRIEVEAIAQEIINRKLLAEDIIIIPFDSSYYDLFEQVFNQYHIPYGFIQRSTISPMFTIASSLLRLYINKDIPSLIDALDSHAFPIHHTNAITHYMSQFISSLKDTTIPSNHYTSLSFNFLNTNEDKILINEEKEFNEFVPLIKPYIEKVLETSNPQTICNDIFNQCVSLSNPANQSDLYALKALLEDICPLLETSNDLELVLYLTENKTQSVSTSCLGRVAITDKTHQLPSRKIAYIVGVNQKSYPGFISESGIFDEEYRFKTPLISMQYRFNSYLKQLKWIEHCANEINFTYPLLDYQGKKTESSFEIESLVIDITELPCISNDNDMIEKHKLTSELASALFFTDGKLKGSVSSFEKYFSCQYAYFLKYGLRVTDFKFSELASNTIGTIQHAILEESCKRFGKDYAKINADTMKEISIQYYESLLQLFPKEKEKTTLIYNKMIDNLCTTFEFLKDMELQTSFVPTHFEYKFTSDFFENITLQGVIDRIDFSYDLLRIIDYKSSSKTLSETSIKAGVQLQLCTYLILAKYLFDKKTVGAYYYSLKNENISLPAIIESKEVYTDWSSEDTINAFNKSHQLSGWTLLPEDTLDYNASHIKNVRLNKNGLSFTLYDETSIEECLKELYKLLVEQLTDGCIEVNPVKNACTYCMYRTICRFKGQEKDPEVLVLADTSLKKGSGKDEVE